MATAEKNSGEKKMSRRIIGAIVIMMAGAFVCGCSSKIEATEAAALKPAADFQDAVKLIKESYVCLESGVTIKEAEEEGETCKSGERVIEIAESLSKSGWNKEKIMSMFDLMVRARSSRATVDTMGLVMFGKADAPVTMIEFTDMQCPYCGRYNKTTFPTIKKNYIDTGKVKYFHVNLPLGFHPQAFRAAEALYCAADQNKLLEMRDEHYDNQKALDVDSLKRMAAKIGLDAGAFNKCMDEKKHESRVNEDMKKAQAAGVGGTPGFVIARSATGATVKGKVVSGAQPTEVFAGEIEGLLSK